MMMVLSMVQPGEEVEVSAIRGGYNVQQRLEAMGFVPGSTLEMVNNQMDGPAIIKVKESRVALGRGLMHHIMVKPVGEDSAPFGQVSHHPGHRGHGRGRRMHGMGRKRQHGKI